MTALRGSCLCVSAAKQMTFTGTREELRERLAQLKARGATGDVERELRAYRGGCWIEVTEARRLFVIARRPSY
jgi:hypothetical protein